MCVFVCEPKNSFILSLIMFPQLSSLIKVNLQRHLDPSIRLKRTNQ